MIEKKLTDEETKEIIADITRVTAAICCLEEFSEKIAAKMEQYQKTFEDTETLLGRKFDA